MIPLARPSIDEADIQAVTDILRSGMLVQGEMVARFEALLATTCGSPMAVAVSSGTTALELALTALGIGPGDEVLCPALTWPSPAHAIRVVGAVPVLVDVDPETWNAGPSAFAARRTHRTRAAIAIDQFGSPCHLDGITDALGDAVPVILDAACAIGSTLDGRPAPGRGGAIACLSFHPRKVVTTGEGGACLVADPTLASRLRQLRNHGQDRPGHFVEAAGNHRLTEVAAALGMGQLARLQSMVDRRRALAASYRAELPSVQFQRGLETAHPNYQTMGAVVADPARRDALVSSAAEAGVQLGLLSYALDRLPSVDPDASEMADETASETEAGETSVRCPNARRIADCGFALPLFPEITDAQQAHVITTVRDILRSLGAT